MSYDEHGQTPHEPSPFSPPPGPESEAPAIGLPWERRHVLGPGSAIVQTITQVLMSPSKAFRDMKTEGGWGEPLGFALLVGSVSSWIAQAWLMLANTLLVSTGAVSPEEVAAANAQEIWSALLAPFLVCAFTVIGAGIGHVLLILFGGAPRPYETTLRVYCYSWSVGLLNLLPICGVFIGSVWRIVIEIIGLREAHPVPTGRAAAAVLVPIVITCICLFFLLFLVFGLATMAIAP